MRNVALAFFLVAIISSACGSSEESLELPPVANADNTTSGAAWIEEDVTIAFGSHQLFGVLTQPRDTGPHPAVVLLSGSGGADGVRASATARIFVDHSRRIAVEGFAVLRFDPPGIGRSTGGGVIPSLEERVEETYAAIAYLQSRSDIVADRIGLQGWSQGPWVMAMTAMRYPDDVAFLISVVGSGQSVAHQQIYGIRAQSEAMGLVDEDVGKAVLFGRLLIDWQLPEPMFQVENTVEARALGPGPWADFAQLVYEGHDLDALEGLGAGSKVLASIRDEAWAEALYLDLYLARLDSLPAGISPEEFEALQTVMAENLMTDPKDFLTEVRVPVLAFFGENDLNVDSQTSPALFEKYLAEAGNDDYTIVVIPDVGHNISLSTPSYWDTLSAWLRRRLSG